jgi:hypothetical protein
MVEPIDKSKKSSASSSKKPQAGRIEEEDEGERTRSDSDPTRPTYFLSPSQSHIASCSPSELTPSADPDAIHRGGRKTDPTRPSEKPLLDSFRAQTHDPKARTEYFPPIPITLGSSNNEAEHQQALGGSSHKAQLGADGVSRKDMALTPGEQEEREQAEPEQEYSPDSMGQAFRIQWIKVGPLAFNRTRLLRNPWNADREVKVSRDGTEVEPSESCDRGGANDSRGIAAHGGMGEIHTIYRTIT